MLVSTNMHINWFKKAQNSTSTYEVVSGDTISGIAKKLLGNADLWKEIVKLNPNIKNPDLIQPGMSLTIPAIRTDAVLKPSEKESTKIVLLRRAAWQSGSVAELANVCAVHRRVQILA